MVDDFNDKGIDAIHYDAKSETLYLLQTKLKESEQFKKMLCRSARASACY